MSCQCRCIIDRTFVQQSSSYLSQVLNREHTCRCQPVTLMIEPFSSQFLFSQRVRSMNSVCFAMLKAEKAKVCQTPQTLCQDHSWLLMLLCDGFQKCSRYRESLCLFRFLARMSPASNNFCRERIDICPSSMSCQSVHWWAFVQHSSSHQSLVPNREHTCRCRAVTTSREPFSSVSMVARVRSVNSVSFAMLKAEKAVSGRHLKPRLRKSLGCWCRGFRQANW